MLGRNLYNDHKEPLDSGEKLQNIATILFYVASAIFVIWGISYFFQEPYTDYITKEEVTKGTLVITGIIIAVGGTFGAFIASLLIRCLGVLVSTTNEISYKLDNLEKVLNEMNENSRDLVLNSKTMILNEYKKNSNQNETMNEKIDKE